MRFLADRRFIRFMQVAFVLACLFAVVMALLPKPPKLPTDRWGDKVEHVIAFSTLALLAALAFPRMPRWRVIERLSFLGALIEVFQSIPALGRDCDVRDWIADTVAVIVVVGLVTLFSPQGSRVPKVRAFR
ncbi:MAG: VanZ family protein [Novosphingobium sp.]